MGGRKKRGKSGKRLAIGAIAVIFVLACFLVYFSLHSSPPKVAIIDHLSFFPEQRNQTFVDTCKNILEKGGLKWAYHSGTEVTVNFYRKLSSYGTRLIILRVHSAIMKTENGTISILGLFTSELYSEEAARKYLDDVQNNRLVRAFFTPGGEEYFGIVPEFVDKSMEGRFDDTIIIMMGCEGLGYINAQTHTRVAYIDMAEAFVKKGAKVYIGWDGPVSMDHTDQATIHLLQSLIQKKRTIREAVEQTNYDVGPDSTYNSNLKYHPSTAEIENYTIPNLKDGLTLNIIAYASPTLRTPKRPEHTSRA